MERIETSRVFPVPPGEAFAFITDLRNWERYWPDFVRIHDRDRARWSEPGDRLTLVTRLLGREVELHMTLETFQRDRLVTYRSQQRGLPDAHHERHFQAVPEGCEYRLVVAYEPRGGLRGLFDRLLVRRSVAGAMRRTLENLDAIFRQRRAGT